MNDGDTEEAYKEAYKKAVASAVKASAAVVMENYSECELTLHIIDKVALKFATALLQSKGYYVKKGTGDPAQEHLMEDAYEAADDFLKEKLKRDGDEFEIQAEKEEDDDDWDDPEEDGCAGEELDHKPIAKVENDGTLKILGVTMFRSGDVCHDPELRRGGSRFWNIAQLQTLVDRINKAI